MVERIKAAFLGMKRFEAIDLVKDAIRSGEDPFAILTACREGMEEVGLKSPDEAGDIVAKLTARFFLSRQPCSKFVFKDIAQLVDAEG